MMCSIDWAALGNFITAIATITLAVLTGLTLKKVREYTSETHNMSRTAQDQLEATQRPVLVISELSESVVMKNIGPGTAFDVSYTSFTPSSKQTAFHEALLEINAPRDVGMRKDIHFDAILREGLDMIITYSSLSGERYETLAHWDKSTVLRLRFRKISQSH